MIPFPDWAHNAHFVFFEYCDHGVYSPTFTPTLSIVFIWINIFQTELLAEFYSNSPVRTIGKVLPMKFS